MKFTINSKVLLSRLVACGKTISNRPTISILGCLLFSLEGDTLSITASDIENKVVSRVPVTDAEGNGRICLDAKRITELLKSMPDCAVSFTVDEEKMTVILRHHSGKYNLSGFPGSEYPVDNNTDQSFINGSFTLPSVQLLSAFDKVGFAIGNDELRPQMSGMFWDIKEDSITFVATDTRVLAKYRSTQTAPGVVTSFILPGRALSLVRAFIGKQAEVKLTITKRMAIFEGSDYMVRATLLNGVFPDYNRVIPQSQPNTVVVDRIDFSNAINRVSICADTLNPFLRFRISKDSLYAIAEDVNYNVGGEERIVCENSGNDIEIGFSSAYLKSLVNTLETQKIVIKLSDASRPGVFTPSENDEFGELTLLCMPINIQSA